MCYILRENSKYPYTHTHQKTPLNITPTTQSFLFKYKLLILENRQKLSGINWKKSLRNLLWLYKLILFFFEKCCLCLRLLKERQVFLDKFLLYIFFYNCEYKLTDRYTDSLFLILLPRYGLNSKYILVCFYFVLSNCFSFIYV